MRKSRKGGSFTISVVAERFALHPQTLRLYERQGLLKPSRSEGNTRLYADEDLTRLELILSLTRDLGVNLAGVEVVLNMREKMLTMQEEIDQLLEALRREIEERAHRGGPAREAALVRAPRRTLLKIER